MTVKCETMADTASASQAPESNQAFVADDSSAKTIESLRARLLSERAASKAARQQAQEIAEKVKDLNIRLEMEIKSRKEAESAMGKVVTILKAKGLAVDALALTDLRDQLERGVLAVDDIKEMNKDPSVDKEAPPKPLENKDESKEKGTIEKNKHITREPHESDPENSIGIVSKVDQTGRTCCDNREASPVPHTVPNINLVRADIGDNFWSQKTAEHHHCQVTDKPMVHTDNISTNSTSDFNKDLHPSQASDQGSSITVKLKAMLHQIEEEVTALPREQPLKQQLQSWVDHVATGILDMEKAAGLNGVLEMHRLDGSSKAGTNYPPKGVVNKGFIHAEEPILLDKKENAAAQNQIQDIPTGVVRNQIHDIPTGVVGNQIHDIPVGVDTKGDMGSTLSIVPKDMLQETNMVPPLTNYNGQFPSAMYPPTGKDPALPAKMFHNRRSSCDSLLFLQQPPMHPQMMQYGISQSSAAHAPLFANGGYAANGHFTGAEAPYYIEAQSPRSSNVFSVGDGTLKVGYRHGQWVETHSQGRGLGLERQVLEQSGYREAALKCQNNTWSPAGLGSREIHYSTPYIVDVDVSNEVHMKHDKYWNPQNIRLERGYAYSHRTYMDQVKNAAEFDMARHQKSFPLSDATHSLTDDRNGRLRDILMVLDAARQRVNDEEQSLYAEEQLFGPPTPTVEDARLNRDYQYGDDMQRVPYEHLDYTWRFRARNQTPIIQFPPSPASEHAYSPFERNGRHRRSSSVSTNFMMSGWDSYPQPRGEVQLGNGITLYTDS